MSLATFTTLLNIELPCNEIFLVDDQKGTAIPSKASCIKNSGDNCSKTWKSS